ncbi:MAG: tetratricopeptide repeat protein [Culicoidibacterales bacterium]
MKKISYLCITALLLVGCQPATQTSIVDQLKSADTEAINGNYQQAITQYNEIEATTTQQKADVALSLAKAYALNNNVDQATKAKDDAIALNIAPEKLAAIEGAIAYKTKAYDMAMGHFDRAIAHDSNDIYSYVNRATIAYEINDYQSATLDAKEAIRLNVTTKPAYDILTNIAINTADYSQAASYYQRLLTIDGTNTEASSGLAFTEVMELVQGEVTVQQKPEIFEKQAKLTTLLAKSPQTSQGQNYQGQISLQLAKQANVLELDKQEQLQQAIVHFENGQKQAPQDPSLRINLAQTKYLNKQYDEALAIMDTAINQNSYNPQYYLNRAYILINQAAGDIEKGKSDIQKAYNLDTNIANDLPIELQALIMR